MSAATSPKSVGPITISVQNVWRANQMGVYPTQTLQTGYRVLDQELPNSGWPHSALIELLPQQAGIGELRLLQPALQRIPAKRCIALVQPPYLPQAAAWAYWDLPMQQLLWIKSERSTDALWAAEQILRNGSCGALLFWQSHMRNEFLRRLHLAAQASDMLFWLMRPLTAAQEASPSPLRLCLHPASGGLEVDILKRRGPPRDTSFLVPLMHRPTPSSNVYSSSSSTLIHPHHAHMDRRPSTPITPRGHTPALV